MGDRGNIVIKQEDGNQIYLYTHWGGYSLPVVLQNALKRGKHRWDNEPYLARIIFCEMVKGYEMDLTGFGISTYECDNEHPHLIVDCATQTVTIDGQSLSFADYVG